MRGIHPVAAAGFSNAADLYERARPSYPPESVAWMTERTGLGPGRTVVDLGAGTGKLTRLLGPSGARVVAVEPIPEMRAKIDGAEALDGTAEEIPLDGGAADVVTVAQALHWFDLDRALPEIHRVLADDGWLALFWNMRDLDDPLQRGVEELLAPRRTYVVAQQEGRGAPRSRRARCSGRRRSARSGSRSSSRRRICATAWHRRRSWPPWTRSIARSLSCTCERSPTGSRSRSSSEVHLFPRTRDPDEFGRGNSNEG